MTRGRRVALAAVTLIALLLAACTGLPTDGSVNPGLAAGDEPAPPDFSFLPDRPQPGASPEEIVEGFIRAGVGPADDWARARLFLAPSAQSWDPTAGVTIDLQNERRTALVEDGGAVAVELTAVATVDGTGAYQAEAGTTPLAFRLAQQDDGEWRIVDAPDGVVLDRDSFDAVFHRYSLMYFDPSWRYLVPDVRWFPTTNTATRITSELVNGTPSPWLAEAVVSAFPDGVASRQSVPVPSGVAQVELSEQALTASPEVLDRMYTQLQASLASAGIADVDMLVDAAPLAAQRVATRSTRVTGPPLVLIDGEFGFVSGGALTPIPGLSEEIVGTVPVAVEVSAERDVAAVLTPAGLVLRVEAGGNVSLADERAGMVDPTIDPLGFIWTVPRDDPGAVRATGADGIPADVSEAFPNASDVSAISVSRDGTRLAAIVTAGGRDVVWVSGIVRGGDDVPQRLVEPLVLGALPGAGQSITWLDDTTVGVLARPGDEPVVLEQTVGGTATSAGAPAGVTTIAGAGATTTMRLRSDQGALYRKRGANWEQTAGGVLVLATQQGTPE